MRRILSKIVQSKHRETVARSFWSLGDQGVVSAGNFLSNVFLARAMSGGDYGAFAIIFGVFLFLNNVHESLVTYPITMRTAAVEPSVLRRYVGDGLLATLALNVLAAIPLAIACIAVGHRELIGWAIGVLVIWQLQETVRRGLMSHLRFSEVIWGDAISFLGQAAVIFFLTRRAEVHLPFVFAGMAATSCAALMLQLIQIGFVTFDVREIQSFFGSAWILGRWLLLNNILSVINLQGVAWVIAAFHGIAQTARLQVIYVVLGVTHPVLIGISALIIPATAKVRSTNGIHAAIRHATSYALLSAALLVPIYLVIAAVPQQVLWLFYKDKYLDCAGLLRLLVLVYAIDFIGLMICGMLYGLEQSRAVFLAGLAASVVTISLTMPLAIYFGIAGALIGAIFSVTARVVASIYFVKHLRNSDPAQDKAASDFIPATAGD